jgi:hypothetical protein
VEVLEEKLSMTSNPLCTTTFMCPLHPLRVNQRPPTNILFVWLVADGWCRFVLRGKYCWLIAGGWFVLSRKSTRTNEQGVNLEWIDIFFESLSTDDEGNLWSDWAGTQQVPTAAA